MTRIPIRWRDLDPLGHVNSAVFMTLLETGRDLWLRESLGPPFTQAQYVIARIEIDFRAEIGMETAHVDTRHAVEAVGRTSITLSEQLVDPAEVTVAQARAVIVLWDPEARRSRPVSAAERERLTAPVAH